MRPPYIFLRSPYGRPGGGGTAPPRPAGSRGPNPAGTSATLLIISSGKGYFLPFWVTSSFYTAGLGRRRMGPQPHPYVFPRRLQFFFPGIKKLALNSRTIFLSFFFIFFLSLTNVMPQSGTSYRSGYSQRSARRRAAMSASGRAASIASRRSRPITVVPRSFGNPRAITERKYFDAEVNGTSLAALTASFASAELDPATLNTLFAPTQGNDYLNREGRKVQILSIKVRGEIRCPAQTDQTATDAASNIRLLLVHDKQTNAAQLNSEDVITSGAGNVAIQMFQNPAFFGRFRVLKDKMITIQNPTVSYDGTNLEQSGLTRNFKMTVKFKKPVIVHFNATNGGTVADIVDNSFHIIGGTTSTGLAPAIYYKVRTVFVDV